MSNLTRFPDWEQLYQEKAVETMPWFNPELDPDLAQALTQLKLQGSGLDLGTGPGTQAIALAEQGFQVTATDLSETAVQKAQARAAARKLTIHFQQDDILNTQLNQQFEFVFDRGCFHVLPPDARPGYVATVARLLKSEGYLFLKTFSHLETGESGPYRFTPEAIAGIFDRAFKVLSITDTVYHGTLDPFPKALFAVLQKQ